VTGFRAWIFLLWLGIAAASAQTPPAPYGIAQGLFDEAKPDLGLARVAGAQTVRIFEPRDDSDKFSNGVVLVPFKGKLYAQWQSSPKDEDTPDTWVAYASSEDGSTWSAPRALAPPGEGGRMHSSGGWWTNGRQLVAYFNVWPTGFQSGDGGYTEYRLSRDGKKWSAPKRVLGADRKPVEGIIEQDPHALPGGRIVTAFHTRPGMIVAPFYTDDPLGVRGWRRGRISLLENDGKVSRELEPSLFSRGDCIVMVFRDQASTFRQLAAESCDAGVTWSSPVVTDMPDSRAKQSAGNLPDGTAFLVNAPRRDRVRIPLALTLGTDGRTFDRAYLLRGEVDLQPRRYEGLYKRPGYHYPKSVIWRDHLYIAYATNKEDVELTRVPLASLR
jgi:hypothetical protein